MALTRSNTVSTVTCMAIRALLLVRMVPTEHLPLVRAGRPRETRAADRWREGRTVPSLIGLAPA